MSHIILLGDSIFDNGVYVPNQAPVIEQLRAVLPQNWRATLCAVDGDVTSDVATQLKKVPADADFLIVSVGGNDALQNVGILSETSDSVAQSLIKLSNLVARFEESYRAMLGNVLAKNLPVAVCTIYNPRFNDATMQQISVAALALFNDAILRTAIEHSVSVIDLRLICNKYEDYANDIEPSHVGGAKITKVIAQVVTKHDFAVGRCNIYC